MKILLVNVHSACNLGDEGIIRATLQGLRAVYPDAAITVAANHAASWGGLGGMAAVDGLSTWFGDPAAGSWRAKLAAWPGALARLAAAALLWRTLRRRLRLGTPQRALLDAYLDADLVLSCGGGNFYAQRPISPSFLTALLSVAFALALGKRVVMLPQSLGPIEGGLQRRLAAAVFARVETLLVRESRSLDFARQELHLTRPVMVLPDLALGLPPVAALALPPGLKLGISAIDRGAQQHTFATQQRYEDALVALAVRLHREAQAQIYLFCQCTGPSPDQDDRRVAARLQQRLQAAGVQVEVLAGFANALTLKSAYAAMDFVVATRMHAAIYALSSGVPAVVIGYQPKAAGLMQMLGLAEWVLPIEEVQTDSLYRRVTALLAAQGAARSQAARGVASAQKTLAGWMSYLEG